MIVENPQTVHSSDGSTQAPQFHTPPLPPGDSPTAATSTEPPTHVEAPTSSLAQSTTPPAVQQPQLATAVPVTNPFGDPAAPAQPGGLQEPPQHPARPLPVGPITETPLQSEPTPILPPRPQPQSEPQSQILPPPRASFDQPIPDHPAMRQISLERAQSPGQTIQHVPMTPAQPQPVAPPRAVPTFDANAQTPESDPAIASLHAMFPDFDLLVIQSVLEATGGDKDQAIDSLLGMSDPEYAQTQTQVQSQTAVTEPGSGARQPTQTELDEQFARRLMLEEEQQASAGGWQPSSGQYNHSVPYQQYQPRRSGEYQRPPSAGAGGGAGGGFGDMANDLQQQFRSFIGGASTRRGATTAAQPQSGATGSGPGYQDQFNRIADTGKKTFNTIFNKVKQKMEEFDNRHPPDTQNMNQPPQTGHWSNWQAPPEAQQHVTTYAQSPTPQQVPSSRSPPPSAQYGALNSNPYGMPGNAPPANTASSANTGTGSALPTSSSRWQYQADGPETLPPVPTPTVTSTTEEPRRSVDASRLGLLPKRPVSLMDVNTSTRQGPPPAQGQSQGQVRDQDSDNESLEYVDRPMPGSMARP